MQNSAAEVYHAELSAAREVVSLLQSESESNLINSVNDSHATTMLEPSHRQSEEHPPHMLPSDPSVSSISSKRSNQGDNLTVLHVRPGSEHQALIYLLRQINRRFCMDDVLPDLPEGVADFEYRILTWPKDIDPNGDATTLFTQSTIPRGLLLKRIRIRARDAWEFKEAMPDRDILAEQRNIIGTEVDVDEPSSFINSAYDPSLKGQLSVRSSLSTNQIKSIRRQLKGRPKGKLFSGRPSLVPVAVPSSSAYLRMAAEAIQEFNSKGLVLTVYLNETVRGVAAALVVQAAWRCHNLRGNLPLLQLIKMHRAARCIQRAWRACLMRCRFSMLSSIKSLAEATENLLLGGNMTMDVRASMLLRGRMFQPLRVYPEHDVQFFFDKYHRVHIVVPDGKLRGGLPKWLGTLVSTMTRSEMHLLHGDEHLVYGQDQAIELLIDGADWKDPSGSVLSRAEVIPEPCNRAVDGDCILQVGYIDVSEARARACLLLALTFDPKLVQGVALLPLHLSSLVKQMPLSSMASFSSSPRTNTGELEMHHWLTIRPLIQPPDDSGAWQLPPGFHPKYQIDRALAQTPIGCHRSPSASPLRPGVGTRSASPSVSHRSASARSSSPSGQRLSANLNQPRSPARSPSSLAVMPERSLPRSASSFLSRQPSPQYQRPPLGSPRTSAQGALTSISPKRPTSSPHRLSPINGNVQRRQSSPPSRILSASPPRGGTSGSGTSLLKQQQHQQQAATSSFPKPQLQIPAQVAFISHGSSRESSAPSSPSRLQRQTSVTSEVILPAALFSPSGSRRLASPLPSHVSSIRVGSSDSVQRLGPPSHVNHSNKLSERLDSPGKRLLLDHSISQQRMQQMLEQELRQQQGLMRDADEGCDAGVVEEGVTQQDDLENGEASAVSNSAFIYGRLPSPQKLRDGDRQVQLLILQPASSDLSSPPPLSSSLLTSGSTRQVDKSFPNFPRSSSSNLDPMSVALTPEPLILKPSTAPSGARRNSSSRAPASATRASGSSSRRNSVRWPEDVSSDGRLISSIGTKDQNGPLEPWGTENTPDPFVSQAGTMPDMDVDVAMAAAKAVADAEAASAETPIEPKATAVFQQALVKVADLKSESQLLHHVQPNELLPLKIADSSEALPPKFENLPSRSLPDAAPPRRTSSMSDRLHEGSMGESDAILLGTEFVSPVAGEITPLGVVSASPHKPGLPSSDVVVNNHVPSGEEDSSHVRSVVAGYRPGNRSLEADGVSGDTLEADVCKIIVQPSFIPGITSGQIPNIRPLQTPNTRLRLSILKAEAYAKDESQMPLLPIGYVQHASFPYAAVKDHDLSKKHASDSKTYQVGEENSELRIIPEVLVHPAGEPAPQTVQAHQASLLRYHSHLHEAFIHAQRFELQFERSTRAHQQASAPPTACLKRSGTGNILAPGYVPMTTSEMGQLVTGMSDVYREVAGQCVKAARNNHSEVMRDIRQEKQSLQKVMVASSSRQAEVADTMRSLYSKAWSKAKQARVNQRVIHNMRKQRQAHERSFSQAFVRQTNLLSRHVADGERKVAMAVRAAQRNDMTAARRYEDEQMRVNVAVGREDIVALNRCKAAEVKRSGFTREMQEYTEATKQYQQDVVALKRLAEAERLQRVGPAGGTWGSKSATLLRESLPLSSVVSAAEARLNQSLAEGRDGTARRLLSPSIARLGVGGGIYLPRSSIRVHSEALSPLLDTSMYRQASSFAPTEGTGGYSANEGGEGLTPRTLFVAESSTIMADDAGDAHLTGTGPPALTEAPVGENVITDYLSVLPFAKGANLNLSQRDKPTGIVV